MIEAFINVPSSFYLKCNTDHLNQEEKRVLRAVTDKVAVAGWNDRIHVDFWIISKDTEDGGTFPIPDANKRAARCLQGLWHDVVPIRLTTNALPRMPAVVR